MNTMKRIFFLFLILLAAFHAGAQQAGSQQPTHLSFLDVEISGNIKDFAERMKAHYRLTKRLRDNYCYIFEGTLFGYSVPIQAYYTPRSQTTYKLMVSPKAVDENAWTDSLTARYGQPIDSERGLLWERPGGIILYYRPEGYNPVLLWLDGEGQAAYSKER